jgi:hypothetical protein
MVAVFTVPFDRGKKQNRKGINGRRLEQQKQMEEEDYIIAKLAQEDVETLYNLLNK